MNQKKQDTQSRKVISVQAVPPELWDKVQHFLDHHRLLGNNISLFARIALENYIDLADKYGLDSDGKIKLDKGNYDAIKTR